MMTKEMTDRFEAECFESRVRYAKLSIRRSLEDAGGGSIQWKDGSPVAVQFGTLPDRGWLSIEDAVREGLIW